FVIATKYGIPADHFIEALAFFAPQLRAARVLARRIGFWRSRLPPLTALGLRDSTEQSLRRLRTDWIDIMLLHEPRLKRLPNIGEVTEELHKLKQRGLIRAFGLAGAWSGISPLLAVGPELSEVLQTAETEWPPESPPDICYGALSRGPQTYR